MKLRLEVCMGFIFQIVVIAEHIEAFIFQAIEQSSVESFRANWLLKFEKMRFRFLMIEPRTFCFETEEDFGNALALLGAAIER